MPGARNKLLGFGMQLLDGIDPNPDNMVCAGIIHTQGQQVGCLLRLEPNRQAQVSWNFRFCAVLCGILGKLCIKKFHYGIFLKMTVN